MSSVVVSNSDAILKTALMYATSSNHNLAMSALYLLTGLRFVEILKVTKFSSSPNEKQNHPSFWRAQTAFAKRGCGKNTTNYVQKRDRPFLAPWWIIERLLSIVRANWPCKHLTNAECQEKFGSTTRRNLAKAFPMWPGVTPRKARK